MHRALVFASLLVAISVSILAAKNDPRLATVRKAFVMPVDDLGDDVPVATCFADHLPKASPVTVVTTKEEADVIFKVKAHLPSATTRYLVGIIGGTPSADLEADLPTGEKLWADGAKLRRAITGKTATTGDIGNPVACGLADELIDTLRSAMRKARDRK